MKKDNNKDLNDEKYSHPFGYRDESSLMKEGSGKMSDQTMKSSLQKANKPPMNPDEPYMGRQ